MLLRQLGLGRADAPNYKEAPRGQQARSKTTRQDMVYVILELEFAQKQRSTSGHCEEEYKPSSEDPQ